MAQRATKTVIASARIVKMDSAVRAGTVVLHLQIARKPTSILLFARTPQHAKENALMRNAAKTFAVRGQSLMTVVALQA
jgi:hypothetical protein